MTLFFYLLSTILQSLQWIIYLALGKSNKLLERDLIDSMNDIAEVIIMNILYYFIFEMKDLLNKLKSETPQEYQER